MPIASRRTLLEAFGIASITYLLPAQSAPDGKVVVVKPGENRFDYTVPQLKKDAACKVTKQDSLGACSMFELVTPPKGGPPRHVHHREDEWFYVLSGEFLFEVGNDKYTLPGGSAIWAPRDIPHVYANGGTTEGRLILTCVPGGFENFFDEFVRGMMNTMSVADMKALHAKYGLEMLGPPLFPPTS